MLAPRHAAVIPLFAMGGCVFDPAGAAPGGDDGGVATSDAPAPPDASPDAARTVPDAGSSCPDGWSEGTHTCYLVVTEPQTWEAARDACVAQGAHLVIIDDAAENERVRSLTVRFPRWLGASDSVHEGDWRWVDDTPVSFAAWAPLQPDDFLFNEDCAELAGDGTWNDTDCSDTEPFVCERPSS